MGWNERSDPDMRTANFKFSCDVYREGVYIRNGFNLDLYSTLHASHTRTNLIGSCESRKHDCASVDYLILIFNLNKMAWFYNRVSK